MQEPTKENGSMVQYCVYRVVTMLRRVTDVVTNPKRNGILTKVIGIKQNLTEDLITIQQHSKDSVTERKRTDHILPDTY